MKLAVSTILWKKIHTITELKSILQEIKNIGFEGVGLETRLLPSQVIKDPVILKTILKETGFKDCAAYSRIRLDDIDWANFAGIKLLWVVARGKWTYNSALKAVSKIASYAQSLGISIAIHNHLRTIFETEEQLETLLKTNPSINICYDTAHAEAARIDFRSFISKYGERIALVHLKDLRKRIPKSKVSITRDFVNVGEGVIDFKEILSELRNVGYNGYVMLETEALGSKEPSFLAKEGYLYVKEILRDI